MLKERKIIQLTFKPASGRGTVTGHVVWYVKKRPGRGYVVAQYRTRLKNGSWSKPIRECFPVVNGKILDIIGRKTITKPTKKRRK
ncbi:hypothetical protein [Butyricicoccus pullicaecorum]|uniref:Uncharacterized protein n=1 Tax=Butyricicoccus pullicaecorum 1.2 TaxID=1203606 RepID=R8VZ52_9FIRM|nr:hypothetical protein [Butyricicoccus pullicaecorum]EOQ37960.1 hypothetical protein HMPREF1526_00988 [Butyricicoccus pullicaecorum 1.2]SKA60742.1 hypothetical protein SAMN02745978_01968 [Butyricicoccus pullicaecorum DSM 23266]